MRHAQRKIAGFDCRTKCEHTPKGDHGIDGGHYYWTVIDGAGDLAFTLGLFADDYPPTVHEPRLRLGKPLGSADVCSAFPTSREDLLTDPRPACEYLNAPCYHAGSSSLATDAFAPVLAYTDDGRLLYDQPAAFWAKLEETAARWFASARRDGAETAKWQLCPTCRGAQTIARKP